MTPLSAVPELDPAVYDSRRADPPSSGGTSFANELARARTPESKEAEPARSGNAAPHNDRSAQDFQRSKPSAQSPKPAARAQLQPPPQTPTNDRAEQSITDRPAADTAEMDPATAKSSTEELLPSDELVIAAPDQPQPDTASSTPALSAVAARLQTTPATTPDEASNLTPSPPSAARTDESGSTHRRLTHEDRRAARAGVSEPIVGAPPTTGHAPTAMVPATTDLAKPTSKGPSPTPALSLNTAIGTALPGFALDAARALATPDGAPSSATLHASIPVPIHHPQFAGALGERIDWMLQGDHAQAELALHPAEMGPIHVQLVMDDGTASLQLMAAQPDTSRAIEAALPQLKMLLEERGVNLGQVHVNAEAGRGGDQGAQGDASRGPRSQRRATPGRSDGNGPETPLSRHVTTTRAGRLDVFA